MKRVAIIGAGVLGQHILHYLNQSAKLQAVGFYDDYQKIGAVVKDLPVFGPINMIFKGFEEDKFEELIMGIGYNHMPLREQLFETFQKTINFATFIHPSAHIDSTAVLGKGVIVLPGCIFDKNVVVKNNVFLNVGCIISHDTMIGSNTFFAPAVSTAGFVNVGCRSFLGINTTVINNINMCNDVQTGGGSVVVTDIERPGVYVGVPAKFLKTIQFIKYDIF